MSVDWIIALHLAALVSALYLLLWRGDEEWYFPIFAVVTVVWAVPIATGVVLSFIAPYVPNPLYVYGFHDFPKEWLERISVTAKIAEGAAVEIGNAMGAVAITMSAVAALMLAAIIASAVFTGGLSLAIAPVIALAMWRYVDPILQLLNAAYQAAAGVYMTFHLLDILAGWAEKWFGPLMAIGLFALLFKPTRTWGALLAGVAMALYVAAAVGAYLSPHGIAIAQWAQEIAEWAKSAPNATGSLSYLVAVGEGVVLVRYNNTLLLNDLYDKLNQFWLSAGLDNRSLPKDLFYKAPKPLGKNGTDWAVAGPGAPAVLYAGAKNFTGLGLNFTYAVYAWLEYPVTISAEAWQLQYPQLNVPIPNLTMPSGENSIQWLQRVRAEESRLFSQLYPIYVADTNRPAHWRLLYASGRVAVVYNNATLLNETRLGVVGVWGWVKEPSWEKCGVGSSAGSCSALDVTARPFLLEYDVSDLQWSKPSLNAAWSNFSLLLPKAPQPTADGSIDFYKWTRKCEWCCKYVNGTCQQWCTTSREEWQEPHYEKRLETKQLFIETLHFERPWHPIKPAQVPKVNSSMYYTYRDWRVWYEIRYGPWSNGPPPSLDVCWVEGNHTYLRIKFWDVRHVTNYAYGFAWMRGVDVTLNDRRVALPEKYDEAPSVDSDGVPVINLLRGAEYDQECNAAYFNTAKPFWDLIPKAAENLTTNREFFLTLLASGNYSRAYVNNLRQYADPSKLPDGGAEWAYAESIGPAPFFPMPETEPKSYRGVQFKVLCARFDWRSEKYAYGLLTPYPGGETWLFGYTLGDSKATRESISALAERWRWLLANPPPPPPASLVSHWPIPWNNNTPLPYKPASTPPMPPPDPRWGVSIWDVGLLINPLELLGKLLGRLWWSVYVALLAPVIVFEVLALVFGFPSITRYLIAFINHVVQDLTYWLGIRLMLRSKLIAKIAKFAGSPVKRASIRLVRRLAHKGWARYRERIRPEEWAIRRRFEAYFEEKLHERIEQAIERVEKAMFKIGQAAAKGIAAAAEAGRRAYELYKRVQPYTEMDAIALLRKLWPEFDYRFEQWMHDFSQRHPVLYTLFLAHLDDKPRWLALINLEYLRRLYVEGKITREQYEQIFLLAQEVRAARAAQWAKYVRERVDEEAVLRAAMEAHREAVRKSTGAFYALLYDLAILDVSDPRAAVERIEARVKAVYEPIARFHHGAFDRLWAVFSMAVGEKPSAVKTPRDLAQWLVENREKVLQAGAGLIETWQAVWIDHWSSARVPYSPYRFAEVEALRGINRELPTLYIIGLARGVVLGARPVEEAKRALEAKAGQLKSVEVVAVRQGEAVRPSFFGEQVRELSRVKVGDVELVRIERIRELPDAEKFAVRLLERAIKAVEEKDEKARREVLEESWRFFREFGERYMWVTNVEERIYSIDRPGAVEMRRAFDEALRIFVERGREEAVKFLRERAEEARSFYHQRGGVEEARVISRLEKEYVKLLEKLPVDTAKKMASVEVVKPAERASLLREVLDKTADAEIAKKAIELYARGESRLAEAAWKMRRIAVEAENIRAELERVAQQHAAIVKQMEEEAARFEAQLIQLRKALDEYVKAAVERNRIKEEYERAKAEYEEGVKRWKREIEDKIAELERRAEEAARAGKAQEAEELRAKAEYLRGVKDLLPERLISAEARLREAEARVRAAEGVYAKARASLDAVYVEAVASAERLRRLFAELEEAERIGVIPSALYYIRDLQGAEPAELAKLLHRAVSVEKSEAYLPDPLTYEAARLFLQKVKELKATGDRRLVEELKALAEILRERSDAAQVLKDVMAGRELAVRAGWMKVDEDALGALVEAFRTAERIVQAEREAERARREAREMERAAREAERAINNALRQLKPPEISAKLAEGHSKTLQELKEKLARLEEALSKGEWAQADRLAGEALAAYRRVRAIEEEAVGRAVVRESALRVPEEVGLRAAAYEILRLAQTAALTGVEEEKRALAEAIRRVFESAAAAYGRGRVIEAVRQLRKELEPYSTTITIWGREHELILFKTGDEVFARAVAYVLLEELAKRAPEVKERLASRLRAIEQNAVVDYGREKWEKALREAREALSYRLVEFREGEVRVDIAVALANFARRVLIVDRALATESKAARLAATLSDLEAARDVIRYFELWDRARTAPREEAAAIAGEMKTIYQRRPEVISELLRARARGEWQRPEELPRYLYKAYAEEAQRRVEEIKQRAVGARRSVEAFEKEARELRNALENALAQIGARDAADFLIRLASITDAVAEAVKALERAAPELERSKQWEKVLERAKAGSLTEKDVERLRAAARDLARAWEAYPRLLEFLQRPDIDAKDLYFLYKAAKDLGLREAADFIALIGAARGVFETYGRELYHNPLYESLLPYLGWREWKALLQAPMGVYVVNRLGERLAREAFGRYILFDLYGEAFRDISTLADVPLTVGMPVAFKARDVFFFLPERSYPDKVAKYVAEWTFQGLTEGIRRYYNSREGIQHRAAAHLMAMAGRAVALYKAYDELMNRAKRAEGMERDVLTALAHAVRARAAYEELKMARLHLKYAERLAELSAERAERIRESAQRHYEALTAEASRKFRESIKEIKSILEKYGKEEREEFLRELGRHLGPAVYKALPDRIHLLVKAADPMRIVRRISFELYDELAKAEEAYRIYRRLEKYLAKSVKTPPSPAPDYSIAMFIEGGAKYKRRVVEEAAAELSYHWLRARAGLLLKVDVTSIAYWHREGQIKLPPEAVKALKAMGAYRKAKLLAERGVEPTPLEIVKARLESDVLAIVAASKATPVAKELGEIATALAFHWMLGKLRLPALVVEWISEYRPEDWRRAKEAVEAFRRGDAEAVKRLIALNAEEALARFKAVVSKFVEEAASIARFSPGAYQRVKEIAEDLSRGGPLEKYLATKIAEALRRVEPLRAPDVEAFSRLPEAVRDGLNRLVRNLEERMLREGYFDAVIKPFSRLFGFGERTDPRELAGRAARRLRELWRVELKEGEAYATGYRQRAEEAYAKALRELEELARAPLAEAAGRAERVFDALAEALSYLVEDRFIAWSEENKDYFNGDELAKTALEIVKEVLGVEARELAAEAIARALGRWAEIGAREYPAWLSQGRLPSTLHLAVVLKTEKYADLLSRRLQVITAAGGGEEGWKIHVFAFHPTLREVVERARSVVADMLSKGKDAPSHIGIAPVEFVFTVANAWITDEGIATSRLGEEWERAVGGVFDYVIGLRSGYEAIRRYDVYLAVRADPKLKVFAEIYGDEWWKAVEAAAGFKAGEMLIKRLREEYGKRGGRRELLWEWKADFVIAPGLLYALADIVEGDGTKAQYKLAVLREFLKWLASPAQLVPKADPHEWREDNELFQAAVKIYAAVTGRRFEEVWQEAVERLRAIQPPGIKEEVRRAAQRPPAEAAEREKPAEKPGEGMKGKAAERPGERAEERGRAAERAEEGAKRPLEKAVERPSERAEGAGQRPLKAEAAGLIPPNRRGVSAVTWLVGVLGRREMGREEAEALRRAVGKAVERVKAKHEPKLYKAGGEALVELGRLAASEAFSLATAAAESLEAVRYMLLLLENAEGPAFGLAPKSPLEADAERVFAKVAEYVRRAEAEFGAGLLVWNYARAVAEAVLKEAERVWEDALRGIATVEQAVKAAVIAAAGVAGYAILHDGLYSTAVVSATAAAVILAREGAFERAVEYVKKAAEAAYEAAREVFEKARITLQRLYELFVEAVARVLDYIRAHWFIIAAAGLIGWLAAQQLDYTLWQNHVALNAGAIAGLAKAAGVGDKWKEVGNAVLTKTASEKEAVERIAQLGLDKGVVERAVSAFSTLRHAVAKEQIENAVLELKRLTSYVQAMKAANYKKALDEASRVWYEQRDPAALWALAVLGAKETGGSVKVFEDEDDRIAYLIASFVLLSRLREFVELRDRAYKALERLEKAVEKGGFTLSDVWSDLDVLAKAEERAREVANELNTIASRLEGAGFSGIAERLKVNMKKAIELAEATQDELPAINATRGERAVAALLSLVTGGLLGVAVERALAERGKWTIGALGIASTIRNTPYSFYEAFKSASGDEKPSEARKLAFRIVSLLADPLVRTILADRQGVEIRVEQKTENGKRRVYTTFVENGRELLKAVWEAGKRLKPLWAEGEAVRLFKEVANLTAAASSRSKLLEEMNEEEWKRVVETVGRVKRAVESIAKTITIGALPTDAVLYPGREYVLGDSSYLSQAFTYWALAEGEINLDKVYPSEEGLKPVWRVDGKYTETVKEVLNVSRTVLEELSKSGIDLRTALADVRINNELKAALEAAASEFWGRVKELLTRWREAEKNGDKETLNKLGKYLRVLLPLAYAVKAYRRGELSREEATLAVIFAVLYDGVVLRGEIWLAVGGPEHEVNPIMTHDNFTAFWLWALKELGFKPSAVYPGREAHTIVFRGNELNELLKAVTPALPALHGLRDALTEFADAFRDVTHEAIKRKYGIDWAYDMRNEGFFKKLEEIITMTEDYVYRNVTVERGPLDTSGKQPKAVISFKLGGEEMAHIVMYWTGDGLQAQFDGSRENAERLASIIKSLGGKAEVKPRGYGWRVQLYTDGITAIRHDGWLKAVRSFVDELYGKGLIDKDRYEQLVKDITVGPNTVKFASVEFSVNYKNKIDNIEVVYQPGSETSKNAAVNALKARGLVEGVHFTVKEYGGYEIRVAKEAYAKAVKALTQSGLRVGEHYAVDGEKRVINIKKDHKDAVVNALKAAGLKEGEDFTVKWAGFYVIRLTYDGLREIQRMALSGDMEADKFIRELKDILERRYGDDAAKKLDEILRPAKEEGTAELPLPVHDERGNVMAQVVDLRYEFVKGNQPVGHCAGKDCRLRIIVEYEVGGERRQLKMEWYWAEKREKKGDATVTYYYEIALPTVKDDVEVAVLETLTRKAKRGKVPLFADQLDALRRFKPLKDAIDKWREGKPK